MAHAVKPCHAQEYSLGSPATPPAVYPPPSAAIIPESAHQIPAPSEKGLGEGVSPVAGLMVAAPSPMPSRLSINCTTRATATPASTAAHETRLIKIVRMSSSGVTGLACGAFRSPRARGVSARTVMESFLKRKGMLKD